jgi:hypothetical protein
MELITDFTQFFHTGPGADPIISLGKFTYSFFVSQTIRERERDSMKGFPKMKQPSFVIKFCQCT